MIRTIARVLLYEYSPYPWGVVGAYGGGGTKLCGPTTSGGDAIAPVLIWAKVPTTQNPLILVWWGGMTSVLVHVPGPSVSGRYDPLDLAAREGSLEVSCSP